MHLTRGVVGIGVDAYDAWGRKTALVDPDKGAWSYTYNGFDELLEQTDARGQRTRFAHDALGRVLQRTDYRADATVAGVAEWTFDRCDEDPGDQVPAVEVAGRLLCETLTEDGELKVAKLYAYDALKRGIATVVALQDQPGRTTVSHEVVPMPGSAEL